jgi:hypothetical protein
MHRVADCRSGPIDEIDAVMVLSKANLTTASVAMTGRRGWSPAGRILCAAALILNVAIAIGEEARAPVGPVAFRIRAQPLIDALQAFSQQSGVQVMFETATVARFNAPSVEGDFSPDVALRVLIADTDLKIRYSRSRAVTLAPASAPDPDLPPMLSLGSADMALETLHVSGKDTTDQNRMGEYVAAVQSDIQKALKRVNQTKRGEYRFAVRLWVDPSSRGIDRAELDGSTGDPVRDARIADMLHTMTLSRHPPPNLPRPIRFMVSINAL